MNFRVKMSFADNTKRMAGEIQKIETLNLPELHNARLRGWQRITTKPKHNNRNHRGSMGLETPRVDSPS
ncbi:hypothetical protein [Vibrio cholerae]|uniref:hypothetical protein n=1 Tax=Vibrio cholerae TaxID=666 RepID=UPI003080618C